MTDQHALWSEDTQTLGRIGAAFRAAQLPPVPVRLPQELADLAVAAWHREDTGPIQLQENGDQRRARHRAGTLALIGLSITERGELDDHGNTAVALDPELIGVAMESADDLPVPPDVS